MSAISDKADVREQMAEFEDKKVKRDLAQYSRRRGTTGPYADDLDLDVLVVGAGFGGVYIMHEMRKQGFKTVIYEAGNDLGGVWRFNSYPGARTDSEVPVYELSIPELWKTWTWSENYPAWPELQRYFDHVDKTLEISKDTSFETVVSGAEFDEAEGKWTVTTLDGRKAKSRFLIVATGFASKRYIPDIPGVDKFKGTIQHVAFWPDKGVDVSGKKTAVIGTGAAGVQVIQEWGPIAKEVKVFQRSLNTAIPMNRRDLTKEEQEKLKPFYPEMFDFREKNFAGYHFDFDERNLFDTPPEDREELFNKLWDRGGFRYWIGNFKDYLFDWEANRIVYDFWAKKIRERITDPRKRELLAPLKQPFAFGIKRPCLEQNYFEQYNRDSVDIVDISDASGNKIEEFTETGIKTTDGNHYEFDVIALATGFDINTGGMTNMGLKSVDGKLLQDEWKKGCITYLGTTIPRYPNLFHCYGPQGPTLLCNGPTSVELQGRWIRDVIQKMNQQGLKFIDPTPEAGKAYKQRITDLNNKTLFPTTRTTHMGGGVPGKPVEQVSFPGGLKRYVEELRSVLPDFKGFRTVKA